MPIRAESFCLVNHLVIIDNHISTRKLTINKMHGNMNACHTQEVEIVSSTSKLIDASKYNLRCNRNISEKMTKKDFIYDIPTAAQTMRKLEIQKRPFILQIQLRRKMYANSKMPLRYIISKNIDHDGSGDATVVTNRRTLKYKCNFCHEPIATLFSLSTHVKFHCQTYCKICYWILEQNETMKQHISNCHENSPGIAN
ncbi:uncharacterized protein [Linepithema humile]|uniref:uncharacterized protein n=1 Tax=Linepithema humile TaxID=83485 RepID=UPI0006237B8A|nr:PREDICTED: uncharacterized protein LOC105677108 [Linepithema humile]